MEELERVVEGEREGARGGEELTRAQLQALKKAFQKISHVNEELKEALEEEVGEGWWDGC